MHNSSVNGVHMEKLVQLRFDAENRLRCGTAPLTKGWTLSADALSVLYKLASTPDSAGEGLKLLHELQTHQVELDLQHEQLEANENGFVQELAHYRTLYDFAPVGYFVVSFEGQIIEGNLAGARLFGVVQNDLAGARLDRFVAPASRATLASLLDKLHFEGAEAACEICICDDESHPLRVHANVSPNGELVLMVVSAAG